MYVWDTSGDERVRESHAVMEGLLCRWDDATVCSYDGGRTWKPRPSGAVLMHPGMDYQCRCCADAYFNELLDEADGVEIGSGYDTTSESTDPGTDIGPIGKAKPVNSINDLKKKDTPFSIDDALEKTNPNYSKGKYEWTHNCQHCCPTYEARRRGYDVIAKPVKAKNKAELAKDKYTNYSKDRFASMFEDSDILIAEGYAKDDIIKSMQEWGDGSRCIICVIWKDWEAHAFVAEQVNGKTIFLDPQINMVYDEIVFENTLFGKTKYFRSDNLDFNDNIIECCLNRKEK